METSDPFGDYDLYVSPAGDDSWSGEMAEPAEEGDDGPFETIERAQRAVRERKQAASLGDGVTVWLRGGTYPRTEPLEFGPEDSAPVTFAAYPGEEPVIDGSRVIEGWEETTVNGVDAWKTTIADVAAGDWYFRTLFVDGERRHRPRLPKAVDEVFDDGATVTDDEERFYHFVDAVDEDGARMFTPEEDSIDPDWHNLTDVDVVAINKWFDERSPIESVDIDDDGAVDSVTVEFRPYDTKQWPDRFYYLDNVFEALTEPGEFYLNQETAECYYVPRDGESIEETTVTAPKTRRLLRMEGNIDGNRPIQFIGFEGITFARTDWEHWRRPVWITGQSAAPTAAAIRLVGAQNVRFEDCSLYSTGEYGLVLREGCQSVTVQGCEFTDLGAGGIKIGSYESDPDATESRTERNRILDNHIHDLGKVFHMGAGVLAMDTSRNTISHNHVHDLFYSAISCGWDWGYQDPVAWDNQIESNYLHDLGKGLLSDMGGVYTLGVQPGTTIKNNRIHDVFACDYGAWGIYPDEGSSHLLIEGNVVYDTQNEPFGQHFGRENVVRNNIFAFGGTGQIDLSRAEEHVSFTCELNVIVTDGQPIVTGGYGWSIEAEVETDGKAIYNDLNLVWDVEGRDLVCGKSESEDERGTIPFEEWQRAGYDSHSIVANPQFSELDDRDFRLADDSMAFELGFESPVATVEAVGPREEYQQTMD